MGRVHVGLRLTGWTSRELLLQDVPIYAENPVSMAVGRIVEKLRVRGHSGQELAVREIINHRGQRLFAVSMPGSEALVEYDLVVRFKDSEQTKNYPILLPMMDARRAWLYGSSLFLIPRINESEDLNFWSALPVTVHVECPPGLPVIGLPDRGVTLSNLYQLMSLQFGFGEIENEVITKLGFPVRLAYWDARDFTLAEHKALQKEVARIVQETVRLFGGKPFPEFVFLVGRRGSNSFAGLEGTYACHTFAGRSIPLSNPSLDPAKYYYALLVHEFFHSWNPVAFAGSEDPWIKEGITDYYGYVLAARLGYLNEMDVKKLFRHYEQLLQNNPLMNRIALTDSEIARFQYKDESWRTVTYERGKAAAFLLDVYLREQTRNRKSLDDVMCYLFRKYQNSSFSHQEFVRAIRDATGVDATPVLRRYVESTEAPAIESLRLAQKRAKQLGIFRSLQ